MCVRVLPACVSPRMCCLGTQRRYSSHHVCADHFQKGLESLTAKRQRQEGREAGAGGGLQAPACGCVSCVSVWAAAPDLPLPGFGLCSVEGPPRPNADSAHPSCGCPPKPLSAARVPRSQRRPGTDSGISDPPFPSGAVASEPLSVSELIGLIWKPGQVTAPEFGWDGV